MGNKLILLALSVFFISLVSSELIVSPNPINVTVRGGEQKSFTLDLQNTFNFTILDFSFSNLSGFNFPTNINISGNQNKTISFTVNRNDYGDYGIQSKVSFKYLVDLPEGIRTHQVNINPTGYSPDFLIIRRGDTVTWTNKDTITRTVTGGQLNFNIPPNQSSSFTFNSIGEFPYQDLTLFYGANIRVINETQPDKVNDPANDRTLNVNLEVTLDPTTLELSNNQDNYNVSGTGSVEGLLQVSNTGGQDAKKVRFSSTNNWVRFERNTIDISQGGRSFIVYHVEPSVLTTQETNKTYIIEVIAKGSNTQEYKTTLSVFIPFQDIDSDVNSNEGFLLFYARYCQQNPNFAICTGKIEGNGNGSTTVLDPTIPFNLTAREVLQLIRNMQEIKDSNARTDNNLKAFDEKYGSQLGEVSLIANASLEKQLLNEKASDATARTFWIIVLSSSIIVAMIICGFVIYRHNNKRNLITGNYKPTYKVDY